MSFRQIIPFYIYALVITAFFGFSEFKVRCRCHKSGKIHAVIIINNILRHEHNLIEFYERIDTAIPLIAANTVGNGNYNGITGSQGINGTVAGDRTVVFRIEITVFPLCIYGIDRFFNIIKIIDINIIIPAGGIRLRIIMNGTGNVGFRSHIGFGS